jgi:hypothetical protein
VGNVLMAFTDVRTLNRRRKTFLRNRSRQLAGIRSEAEEVAWAMGSRFSVQVLAGCGGMVSRVLAGDVDRVSRDGQILATRAWSRSVPQRADIVVAAVEGPSEQQTWANVARALTSAWRIAEPDGSILVCSQVSESAERIIHYVDALSSGDGKTSLGALDDDGWTAAQFVHALDEATVYLFNQPELKRVEDTGIVLVRSESEVRKLISRHASCAVLGNAQYAVPTVRTVEVAVE